MRLVIRLTGDWLTAWQRYSERRQLRRESSTFAIRRWFCQQPVVQPMASMPSRPSTLRLVHGGVASAISPSMTTHVGVNAIDDYNQHGVLFEQDLRRG